MPGGDGTGPLGKGPARGVCIGVGFRRGRGMGRGSGIGFGRGFAGIYPADARSQQEILKSRASVLEQELAALKSQLAQEDGE